MERSGDSMLSVGPDSRMTLRGHGLEAGGKVAEAKVSRLTGRLRFFTPSHG